MADLKTIEDLTNAFGPSGFEEEVVKESPTRPTNIKSATSNLLSLPSKGVAFRLEPTVLMAETHSKVDRKSVV